MYSCNGHACSHELQDRTHGRPCFVAMVSTVNRSPCWCCRCCHADSQLQPSAGLRSGWSAGAGGWLRGSPARPGPAAPAAGGNMCQKGSAQSGPQKPNVHRICQLLNNWTYSTSCITTIACQNVAAHDNGSAVAEVPAPQWQQHSTWPITAMPPVTLAAAAQQLKRSDWMQPMAPSLRARRTSHAPYRRCHNPQVRTVRKPAKYQPSVTISAQA